MKYLETPLKGTFVLELERLEDERGFFARSWCKAEFESRGLYSNIVQCNVSFNRKKGTLRGMHYQVKPHEEAKLVRCTMGALYDVIIDIRKDSATFRKWHSVELSAKNHRMLYIPEGLAHGYLTLEDDSEVFYQMSERYYPECARGVRWNDPAFNIQWPDAKMLISARDREYPDFKI